MCQFYFILKFQIEYNKENGGGNGSTLSRVFDDLEIKQLLRPGAQKNFYQFFFEIFNSHKTFV